MPSNLPAQEDEAVWSAQSSWRSSCILEESGLEVFSFTFGSWFPCKFVSSDVPDCIAVSFCYGENVYRKHLRPMSEILRVVDSPQGLCSLRQVPVEVDPEVSIDSSRGRLSGGFEASGQDGQSEYGKLCSLETIFKYMEATDLRLVRFEYLQELCRRNAILPRRQDIADSNLWSAADLRSSHKDITSGRLRLCAISHPWWAKHHPDPKGAQLAKIVSILEKSTCLSDFAVFYCFCCAPQHDWKDPKVLKWMALPEADRRRKMLLKGTRTDAEEQNLQLILKGMHIPYASSHFHVVLLDDDDMPLGTPNSTPYSDRGWTTFEQAVASLGSGWTVSLKHAGRNTKRRNTYAGWLKGPAASTTQFGRLMPEEFERLIELKTFYSQRDASQVSECYRQAFRESVSEITLKMFSTLTEDEVLHDASHLHKYLKMKMCRFTMPLCALTTDAANALRKALVGQHRPKELVRVELEVAEIGMPRGKFPWTDGRKWVLQRTHELSTQLYTLGVSFNLEYRDGAALRKMMNQRTTNGA